MATIEFFVQLSQFVEFFLLVKLSDAELVFEHANEALVLRQEGIPIGEIANTKSHAQSFAGIGGSDALVSGSQDLLFRFTFASLFLFAVRQNLDGADQVRSGAQLKPTLVINTVLVELSQFLKHARDIDNSSISHQVDTLVIENSAGE